MSRPIVFALGVLGAACATAVSFPTAFEQLKQASSESAVALPGQAAPTAARRPATPVGPQTVRLAADLAGHYRADLRINGSPVAALVDTGASLVALTAEDAGRAGVIPNGRRFVRMSTANGEITAPLVTLNEVRLGDIVVRDVDAVINPPGTLHQTLLGMTFLKKLEKFEMASGRLSLTQ